MRSRNRVPIDRIAGFGTGTKSGRSTQSSLTTWGRSPITCIKARTMPHWSDEKENPKATISRRSTTIATTISRIRSWDWSRERPRTELRRCLENWNKGENGILDLSKAYRLKRGTGWLIPPGVLARPRFLVHLRTPMGQRCVRHVPEYRRRPLRALVAAGQRYARPTNITTWILSSANLIGKRMSIRVSRITITLNQLSPNEGDGWCDRWIVYGTVNGQQLFTARELTVEPGCQMHARTIQGPAVGLPFREQAGSVRWICKHP